jgi:hypothetical protein
MGDGTTVHIPLPPGNKSKIGTDGEGAYALVPDPALQAPEEVSNAAQDRYKAKLAYTTNKSHERTICTAKLIAWGHDRSCMVDMAARVCCVFFRLCHNCSFDGKRGQPQQNPGIGTRKCLKCLLKPAFLFPCADWFQATAVIAYPGIPVDLHRLGVLLPVQHGPDRLGYSQQAHANAKQIFASGILVLCMPVNASFLLTTCCFPAQHVLLVSEFRFADPMHCASQVLPLTLLCGIYLAVMTLAARVNRIRIKTQVRLLPTTRACTVHPS